MARAVRKQRGAPRAPAGGEQSLSALVWECYLREYNGRAAELGLTVKGPRTLGALVNGRYPVFAPNDAQRAEFFASLIDELLPASVARCAELAGELGRIRAERECGAHQAAARRKSEADKRAADIRTAHDALLAQGRAPRDVAGILARKLDLTPHRIRQILRREEKRK